MNAAICAVGSELLGTDRLDTNSLEITRLLRRFGVQTVVKSCVGDDERAIERTLDALAAQAELVVITGGLGPTADDRTRTAVATLCGLALHHDDLLLAEIEAKYRRMQRPMPQVNRRQAQRIDGAEVLRNDWGTAPGQRVDWRRADGRQVTFFLYPGVPRELLRMLPESLEPWLRGRLGEPTAQVRVEARVACVPESAVEERIAPLYEVYGADRIAVLARPADLRVRVEPPRSETGDESLATKQAVARLHEVLADTLYSVRIEADGALDLPAAQRGGDLEEVVGDLLVERRLRISVAESCTGGLLGQRLTAVAGSSAYFEGGALTYSNRLKQQMLGVDAAVLERHGAVSEEVARAMAGGAADVFATGLALAITGVAGPGGGSEEKPVGTVHLALATPEGTWHQRHRFPGERARVRWQATQVALDMVRRWAHGLPETPSWWPVTGVDA